jgi:hypothetical protein
MSARTTTIASMISDTLASLDRDMADDMTSEAEIELSEIGRAHV